MYRPDRGAALTLPALLFALTIVAQSVGSQTFDPAAFDPAAFDPSQHRTFEAARPDGRWDSSRGWVDWRFASGRPRLAVPDPSEATPPGMAAWRSEVAQAMDSLMAHPAVPDTVASARLWSRRRDGYRTEKWELYPLEGLAVPVLVQIPDGATAQTPARAAVLCIPGWCQTKEEVAGEPRPWVAAEAGADTVPFPQGMARQYALAGCATVSIDNPGTGETSDLERQAGSWRYDLATLSRALLEQGWSYLGLTSYLDRCALQWMRQQDYMPSDRMVVSGFSFGTEPLMALGALEPDIFAFVYNDFLCATRERATVMTVPDAQGYRPWPNDIEHLIPGFLERFDFPDLVAALAPRPVVCTEGGMDRDLLRVASAYRASGAPDGAFTYFHYPRFQADTARTCLDAMPRGVTSAEFFRLANVDPPRHGFKASVVLPWLDALLGRPSETR